MPSMAPRSFLQVFSRPRAPRESALLPLCFTQAASLSLFSLLSQSRRLVPLRGRRCASISTKSVLYGKHINGFEYGQSGLPIELEALMSPKFSPGKTDWDAVIDPYLPPNLRLGTQSSAVEQASPMSTQPVATLPQVLSSVRQQSQIDLLSYVGVYQGRWEQVLWLVQAMMKDYTGRREAEERSEQLSKMLWPSDGRSLDALTAEAIKVESPGISRISLKSVMNQSDDEHGDTVTSSGHRGLGEIWQSLGTMILQAADRSPGDPTYSVIMTQVFRILGHLHRIGAFPELIYNYTPSSDQTVIQRPPTLYLLSKRIMSTLSDVEFSLQWQQEMLKYQQQGYEVATTSTSVPPKIHEFGPELWLDLVLWACVEGGWITEGAWVIGEMERRKASQDTCWSVISWQEICTKKIPELDLASILRFQIDKTRLNQVGGIGIAMGGDFTVDMGTRTISREVVLAVMDGLLNTGHLHSTSKSTSFAALQQRITSCKNLLERGHPDVNASLLNATILRNIETAGVDGIDAPGVLQRILDIRLTISKKAAQPTKPLLSAQNDESDDTAPILGLLHRNLYGFANGGNIQGTLAAFRRIQGIIDANRSQSIEAFANELKMRSHEADDSDNLINNDNPNPTATHSPQLPVHTLIAFLDLITESKFYDLGKWLLQNDDIDDGVINPELFSDRNLQAALLRFATATADDKLLSQILVNIEQPIPEPVLHALLRCQVVMGKWSAVQDLLEHFRRTAGMSWKASDAMAIAAAILQLQNNPSGADSHEQILEAQDLLTNLLQGKYNSPPDPSQPPNFSEIRLANQLGRIFKTLPTSLKNLVIDNPRDSNRAHASVSITPNAFNILLEAMVDRSGPAAGKGLWERWCREPGESRPKSSPRIEYVAWRGGRLPGPVVDEERERVVTPTRYMLRNILRPILGVRQRVQSAKNKTTQEGGDVRPTPAAAKNPSSTTRADSNSGVVKRALTPLEQEVRNWGIAMYKKFGLSAKEINAEIPGAVPRIARQSAKV